MGLWRTVVILCGVHKVLDDHYHLLVHFRLSTALLDSQLYSQCKAMSVATYTSMVTTDLLLPDLSSILCSQSGYCLSSSCTLFDTGMCFKDTIQRHVTSSYHVKNVGPIHADQLFHPSNVVQWSHQRCSFRLSFYSSTPYIPTTTTCYLFQSLPHIYKHSLRYEWKSICCR
jgi:hypothetical protein